MRERHPFGSESRAHAGPEREHLELEGRAPAARRTIILVSGMEFPRYKKTGSAGWKANALRRIRSPKAPGFLSRPACRPPQELGLKYAGDVLVGSDWRRFALRVAVQKLTRDPALDVVLFDLDNGTEEQVVLRNQTLSAIEIRKFVTPEDADFRLLIEQGGQSSLTPVKWNLPSGFAPAPPQVRFYPFVTELGTGPVDRAEWYRRRAWDTAWLDQYARRPHRSRLLSVIDVYRRIEEIGRNAPYTLAELQLWGHASSSAHGRDSGTAFANTDHVTISGRPDGRRHPLDLDARASRDFDRRTIDRRLFRMAFARGAMSIVWGCNWSRPYFDILNQTMQQLKGKSLDDDAQFVFSWREGTGGRVDWFRQILGVPANASTKNIKKDGKFVREMVGKYLRDTYMQQLANLTSRCVAGGVPGVGSDYDARPERKEPCLSNIPMAPLYGMTQNMRPVLDFYATHFGVPFHREGADPRFGRGFSLFCPEL